MKKSFFLYFQHLISNNSEEHEKAEESDNEGEEDLEKAMAKELQAIKAPTVQQRFQNCRSGAKNCIFIKTTLEDPVGLAVAIFTDLQETKKQKTRNALRLLPVVGTCKATVKDITELAKSALAPFFTETKLEVTYGISFKARNNTGLGREGTLSSLRSTIEEEFSSVLLRYADSRFSQVTILIEAMCGVACIAVAKDFARFRKYNLVEICNEKPVGTEKKELVQETATAPGDEKDVDKKERDVVNEKDVCNKGEPDVENVEFPKIEGGKNDVSEPNQDSDVTPVEDSSVDNGSDQQENVNKLGEDVNAASLGKPCDNEKDSDSRQTNVDKSVYDKQTIDAEQLEQESVVSSK